MVIQSKQKCVRTYLSHVKSNQGSLLPHFCGFPNSPDNSNDFTPPKLFLFVQYTN